MKRQKDVISSGCGYDMYYFARDDKGADIKEFQDGMSKQQLERK